MCKARNGYFGHFKVFITFKLLKPMRRLGNKKHLCLLRPTVDQNLHAISGELFMSSPIKTFMSSLIKTFMPSDMFLLLVRDTDGETRGCDSCLHAYILYIYIYKRLRWETKYNLSFFFLPSFSLSHHGNHNQR